MALPSALLSLSQSLLLSLPLVLGKQLTGTAPTHWTSQQSPVGPGPTDRCGPHEYRSAGHCCLLCPAGEYVLEPCSRPHTRGQCEKCDRGTYTAFPNGLESCLLCGTCPEEQEEVAECTATSNRRCRCRPGRFYKAPSNEEFCMRCSSKCPEGTVVLQQCNSTADTVCGPPGPESRHRLWLVGSFLCSPFALTILCLCIKKPKDGGPQPMYSRLPSPARAELELLEETSLGGSLAWGGIHHLPSHPVTEKALQATSGDHTLLSVPTGPRDRGESLGPESSVRSGSLHGTREADPPGLTTGDRSLSACHLDLVSEAPALPSIPESPAGMGGPQAAAGDEAGPCTARRHLTPHIRLAEDMSQTCSR